MSPFAFYGAAAALAISTPLPWASGDDILDVHLRPVGVVIMLAFALAYAAVGYGVSKGRHTRMVIVALWLVNIAAGFIVAAVFSRFSSDYPSADVNPGIGVFLAGIGVIVGVVATIMLMRQRKRAR